MAAVAAALFDADQQGRATALVSGEFATVRAGSRLAFYDLTCTHLPQHPDLFRAWLGHDTDMAAISRELAAIERWWA